MKLPKEQETNLFKTIDSGDKKKFDSLLEQYGIKQQFYQMLDQIMKSQQGMKSRADNVTSASENMYQNLPQPLLGGNEDSKAYTENLEKAKKAGEDNS